MRILFSAPREEWNDYVDLLPKALAEAGIEAEIIHALEPDDPASIDYIIYAPSSALKDFTPYTGAKAVLNLWAGVENVVKNATLTQPLARTPCLSRWPYDEYHTSDDNPSIIKSENCISCL